MGVPCGGVAIEDPGGEVAPGDQGCGECVRLREQVRRLTLVAQDQAKTLSNITSDCPPDAPSLAIVYWKWADARSGEPSWYNIWHRIRWLLEDIGDLPAPLLTPLKWDEFRARRRAQITRRGGPPCDATLNLELVYARAMLNFAVERGIIRRNPLLLAKQVPTISQRETRLTPDDIEKLLAAADDVTNRRIREGDDDGSRSRLLRAFLLCIFDSMLRFTEARTLKLNRIGADGTYELLGSETKSKKRRFIKLSGRALEAIAEIKRPERAVYVFEDKDGLVTDNRMRDYFRRACEMSGVDARATARDKRVRPHDARAGGATTADENGARARAIQRTLGHSSLRMTERYLRSEDQENARHVGEIMERATMRVGPKRAASRNKLRKVVDG